MAHNIEIRNGIASYAENAKQEIAWHKLGQRFDRPMFVNEALTAAHADYEVGLQPLLGVSPQILEKISNNEPIDSDTLLKSFLNNKKVTMRLDTNESLGVVSNYYGIVQNKDAFAFIDTLCSGEKTDRDHTPVIECAGVLGKGERVFITAKFPEQIQLDNKGNDLVNMYMVFTTTHDGTGAVNCLVTPVRVVCNNTLNLAFTECYGKLSLRHTANVNKRMDLVNAENAEFAYKAMNLYSVYKKSLKENLDHLANIRLSEKQLDNILAEVMMSEENYKVYKRTNNLFHKDISKVAQHTITKVKDNLVSGIGQKECKSGTGLWLINGLTTYYQNSQIMKDLGKKFDSQMNGYIKNKVQKAYDLVSLL